MKMKTMTGAVTLMLALCGATAMTVAAPAEDAKTEPKKPDCQSVLVRVQVSETDAADIAEEDGVDKHELATAAQIGAGLQKDLEAYLTGKGLKIADKGGAGVCELTLTVGVDSLGAVLARVQEAATLANFVHLDQEAAEAVQGLDDSEPGQGIVFHLTLAGVRVEDYLYMDADTLESAQNDAATDCKKLMAGIGDASEVIKMLSEK